MVLADLGRQLTSAFQSISSEKTIDEKALDSILKEICTALLQNDVNVRLVSDLRSRIKSKVSLKDISAASQKRYIQKVIYDELCNLVDPKHEPFTPHKGKSNVIMMVGLQGSGKTTTCTKLALYYKRRNFKVGLVCADTFRAGAFDQLKQNATRARIPFYGSYNELDPVVVASDGVKTFRKEKFEIIIVDTSGRHRQEQELFTEMQMIQEAVQPDQTIMILDASIGQAAQDQAKAFKESANFGSVIITKMDGSSNGGGSLSAVAATKTSIAFIGTGEHINDLDAFSPKGFISRLLGLGDLQGLLDHVKGLDMEKNKSMMKNLEKGLFSIKDMRDQLLNIMNMGPLSKIAAMIPGMGNLMNENNEKEGSTHLKRMIYLIDSMTEKELNSDGSIFIDEPSRMVRVAQGSGTSVREVEETLSQVKVFAGMAKKLGGKSGLLSRMNQNQSLTPQQISQAQRNMAQSGMKMNMNDMMQMAGNMDMGSLMSQFGGLFGGGGR